MLISDLKQAVAIGDYVAIKQLTDPLPVAEKTQLWVQLTEEERGKCLALKCQHFTSADMQEFERLVQGYWDNQQKLGLVFSESPVSLSCHILKELEQTPENWHWVAESIVLYNF